MKYAVIDVGSNAVRLTAYECNTETSSVRNYLNEREMIGLASYIENGELSELGIQKLASVLKRYKMLTVDLEIDRYYVIATAAIRNVQNTEEIVAKVNAMSGVTMQVISGEEEAKLDFIGVMPEIPDQDGIMVDVGGGSTEIILFEDRKVSRAMSIPIGSLQLYRDCVDGFIPTSRERKLMKQKINRQLDQFMWSVNQKIPVLYGIGGTSRCALRLAEELYPAEQETNDDHTVSMELIHHILNEIKEDLHGENHMQYLKRLYQAAPDRLFTILPGLLILHEISKRVQAEELKACFCGIREGYLYQHVLKE